jgi:hypothetical protein
VIAKETANRVGMSQPEEPKPPATSTRRQTPRVPSNVLYDRIIPIVLVIVALVLLAVLVVVILGAGQPY